MELKRILKLGDSGEDVKYIQRLLLRIGYGIIITGTFDKTTERMVKDFQSKYGLTPDGIVGPKTYSRMIEVADRLRRQPPTPPPPTPPLPPPPTEPKRRLLEVPERLKVGDMGPVVKNLQIYLRRIGYEIPATGLFDTGTMEACRDFQIRYLGVPEKKVRKATSITRELFLQIKQVADYIKAYPKAFELYRYDPLQLRQKIEMERREIGRREIERKLEEPFELERILPGEEIPTPTPIPIPALTPHNMLLILIVAILVMVFLLRKEEGTEEKKEEKVEKEEEKKEEEKKEEEKKKE